MVFLPSKLKPAYILNPNPQTEIVSLGCKKSAIAAPRPKSLFLARRSENWATWGDFGLFDEGRVHP